MPDWYVAIAASKYVGLDFREWDDLPLARQQHVLAAMKADADAQEELRQFHAPDKRNR